MIDYATSSIETAHFLTIQHLRENVMTTSESVFSHVAKLKTNDFASYEQSLLVPFKVSVVEQYTFGKHRICW